MSKVDSVKAMLRQKSNLSDSEHAVFASVGSAKERKSPKVDGVITKSSNVAGVTIFEDSRCENRSICDRDPFIYCLVHVLSFSVILSSLNTLTGSATRWEVFLPSLLLSRLELSDTKSL